MENLLAEQLKKGDDRAYRYIYSNYYVMLCHIANQILGNMELADEIADNAILYLWENKDKIIFAKSVKAYLIRTVHNMCINELKSKRRKNEVCTSSFSDPSKVDFLEYVFSNDEYPLGNLFSRELERQLKDSIEHLPKECKAVFKKNRFEHKKYNEIAVELNISINTVKYHMKNALAELNKELKKYFIFLLPLSIFFLPYI